MAKKLGILLLLSAAIALAETVMVYLSRTCGWFRTLPVKIKFTPDYTV
jgi:hypothetical protein